MMTRKSWKSIVPVLIVAFTLSGAYAQEQSSAKKAKGNNQSIAPLAASSVTESGTPGQITKWTGVSGSNTYTIGDSTITEDKFGKVGIGTPTPTSLLTVAGMIETTLGGNKFPDGTVQTTAGMAPTNVVRSLNGLKGDLLLAGGANITVSSAGNTITVAAPNALTKVTHDNTLTGEGTAASPLSAVSSESLIQPFAVEGFFVSPPGAIAAAGVLTSVPTGKRLVIEHASAACVLPAGQRVLRLRIATKASPTAAIVVGHQLVPVLTAEDSVGSNVSGSAAMKLYAHSGTDVTVLAERSDTFGNAECRVSISGFFVDLPPQQN